MGVECAKSRPREASISSPKRVKSPSKLKGMDENLRFALNISDL